MTDPKPPFKLTAEDKLSSLWRKLMAHWQEQLDSLRTQNDGDRSEIETARLRGRIAGIKANMGLNDDPRDIEL